MKTKRKTDEFFFHLGIVISNLRPEWADHVRRARGKKPRNRLLDSFHIHQAECDGGYSDERCPCAWSAKGFHTLMAVALLDEIAPGQNARQE